jgi:hypothetical protein
MNRWIHFVRFGAILASLLQNPVISQMAIPKNGYESAFFAQHFQHRGSFETLSDVIVSMIKQLHPTSDSIVDIGCGHGLLVELIRNSSEHLTDVYCLEGTREASQFWPSEEKDSYFLVDITDPEASSVLPKTDVVISFETGEHIPEWGADQYMSLVTLHQPKIVIFSAATRYQDRGINPTHINEQPLSYWIDLFHTKGYKLDVILTTLFRKQLLEHPRNKNRDDSILKTWWYPKNTLIFIPDSSSTLLQANVFDSEKVEEMSRAIHYISDAMNSSENEDFAFMWKRDWNEFQSIFEKHVQIDSKMEL